MIAMRLPRRISVLVASEGKGTGCPVRNAGGNALLLQRLPEPIGVIARSARILRRSVQVARVRFSCGVWSKFRPINKTWF